MSYLTLHTSPAARARLREVLGEALSEQPSAAPPDGRAWESRTVVLLDAAPDLIRALHASRPETPLLVVADLPDAAAAAACFRAGAADVLGWSELAALPAAAAQAQAQAQPTITLQQQTAEIAALYRAATALLGAPTDVPALAQQIIDQLAAEFQFFHVAIGLVNPTHHTLEFVARTAHEQVTTAPLPLAGPGLTAAAVRAAAPVYAPEVGRDPRYVVDTTTTRSELVIPLIASGAVLGVLDLQSPEPDAFSARDQRLVQAYAEHAALALQNAQLVADLTLARHAAETANSAKSEFLANTSHELRTPLTGILGALDLVLEGLCETPEEERRFVLTASQAARQLLTLINDLLDIAKLEAGQLELNPVRLETAWLAGEAITLAAAAAAAKRLTVTLAPAPPGLSAAWADYQRTRQILAHLLDNAVKFTPPDGRIELTLSGGPQTVRVHVTDNGIGISADQQARLFQLFSQGDGSSTRKFGGSGLGLTLARRLAELMGGTLDVYSAGENRGVTATLTLPAAGPEAPSL